MPVSMSMSSPSHRAATDEARAKARAGKASLTPGPGAYDPKRQSATSSEVAGSAAFKSKSDRKSDGMLREQGDPGAYNPYSSSSVVAQSSRSFNKSQQTGAGGFGTKSKRPTLSVPSDSPGPGTYDSKLPISPEAKQGSSFASQTKRGSYLHRSQTPGSGEYDPKRVDKTSGGVSMFKNKDERFKKSIELEYAAHVGPGSYDSASHLSVEKRSRQQRGKVSSSFASTSLRGDMFMGHRC